mgnify:CR=1 FL=1
MYQYLVIASVRSFKKRFSLLLVLLNLFLELKVISFKGLIETGKKKFFFIEEHCSKIIFLVALAYVQGFQLERLGEVVLLLGTFSNEEGNANDDGSEKNTFRFALYFFVRFIMVLFSPP